MKVCSLEATTYSARTARPFPSSRAQSARQEDEEDRRGPRAERDDEGEVERREPLLQVCERRERERVRERLRADERRERHRQERHERHDRDERRPEPRSRRAAGEPE